MWQAGMNKEEEPAGGNQTPAVAKWSAGKATFEGVPEDVMVSYLSAGRQQPAAAELRAGRDPR